MMKIETNRAMPAKTMRMMLKNDSVLDVACVSW
jgi:hypothetical protein